ncbi:MAG: diguanylate cyclase, partial [Pirellulaceae bacterium]
MHRITATVRITVGLVALSLSTLFLAGTLGFVPDPRPAVLESRMRACEAVALSSSALLSQKALAPLEAHLQAVVSRNPALTRIVVRETSGHTVAEVFPALSPTSVSANESLAPVIFPLFRGRNRWGTIEFHFAEEPTQGVSGWLRRPFVRLSLFIGAGTFIAFYLFLRRMLQHLDPSKAVPDRVRSALNTLAEGLIIIDEHERIVLANDAFARTMRRRQEELIGKQASKLGWSVPAGGPVVELPWSRSLEQGEMCHDIPLAFEPAGDEPRVFRVNSTPVLDSQGRGRGALATFNDITTIEKSRAALRKMLEELSHSRDEIKRQNQELQIFATRDSLTGCLNRRSFFEQFDQHWQATGHRQVPLSCVMVDVDHFKSINDRFGHAVGDKVLQRVSAVLRESAREGDLVCRYGGEEFAVLLPGTNIAEGWEVAERLRLRIAALELPETSVTASLGVAERTGGTDDSHALLNEADKCLYVAKRSGRNRVVRRDEVTDEMAAEAGKKDPGRRAADTTSTIAIPFQAVTALFSALAYRDHATAEHSRRVADMVVAVAHGMMSTSEVYVLETAALLHDIGKIGVPDAILLKQSPLTADEWQVMSRHDRIGVEIIHSAFCCDALSEIVQSHQMWFNRQNGDASRSVPAGARILQIADAYDAMVSHRVYRTARSHAEACAELRRCAGTQFDPALVERFITVLERQHRPVPGIGHVDKQFALQIGLEIERIADTLDGLDIH